MAGNWLSQHKPIYLHNYENHNPFEFSSEDDKDLIPDQTVLPVDLPNVPPLNSSSWTPFVVMTIIVILGLIIMFFFFGLSEVAGLMLENSATTANVSFGSDLASSTFNFDPIDSNLFLTPVNGSTPIYSSTLTATVHVTSQSTFISTPIPINFTVTPIDTMTPVVSLTFTPITMQKPQPSSSLTPVVTPTVSLSPTSTAIPLGVASPPTSISSGDNTWLNPWQWYMLGFALFISLQIYIILSLLHTRRSIGGLSQLIIKKSEVPIADNNIQPASAASINISGPLLSDPELKEVVMPIKRGFATCITRSKDQKKPENNEDATFASPFTNGITHRIITVADGVGMAGNSKIASQEVVRTFEQFITRLGESTVLSAYQILEFYKKACENIRTSLESENLPIDSAATTFIGVVEKYNQYIFTQLADGSAYRIIQSDDGSRFSAQSMFLSTASPDVPRQMGANGMYQKPDTIIVPKQSPGGYLWVIATDGMNDFDWDDKHNENINGTKDVERLANEIWLSFKETPNQFTEKNIENILWRWLKRCQTTDDAAVAVLIDGEMIERWQHLAH